MSRLGAIRTAFRRLRDLLKDPSRYVSQVKEAFFQMCVLCGSQIKDIRHKSKDLFGTNIDLGLYHFHIGNFSEAAFRFGLITWVKRDSPLVHYNLARCFFYQRKLKKAAQAIERALGIDPEHQPSIFYKKKINGSEAIKHIPAAITQEYFDYHALAYVQVRIIDQGYEGYNFLFRSMIDYYGDKAASIDYLDLGCGTGVCGQMVRLRGLARMVVGVDISPKMLEVAKQCYVDGVKAYNELLLADINTLELQNSSYDLISIMDVCDYIGDFNLILMNIKKWLREKGLVVGAVRALDARTVPYQLDGDPGCNFYRFTRGYLEGLFAKCGFRVLFLEQHDLYEKEPYWCWVVS